MRSKIIAMLLMLCTVGGVSAADLENGAKLYRPCALCHGHYAKGISGGLYPRLAGLPKSYLMNEVKEFRDGVRKDPLDGAMPIVGGFHNLSDKDIEDVSAFIANIYLAKKDPLSIPNAPGDPKAGKKLYRGDCKSCHGRKAEGKESKESPMLAGQYTEYLALQIKRFKVKDRHHDNDPEDETFDDYTDEELRDILSYISTLDD